MKRTIKKNYALQKLSLMFNKRLIAFVKSFKLKVLIWFFELRVLKSCFNLNFDSTYR